LSYAPTVGILAGRTNENYSIRLRFSLASVAPAKSAITFIVCIFCAADTADYRLRPTPPRFFSTKTNAARTKEPEAGVAKCPVRDRGHGFLQPRTGKQHPCAVKPVLSAELSDFLDT